MIKKLILIVLVLCLAGCARIEGTRYGSGTVIGVSAGYEGANLTVGFRRFEALANGPGEVIDVGLEGSVTATGLEGRQHLKTGVQDGR